MPSKHIYLFKNGHHCIKYALASDTLATSSKPNNKQEAPPITLIFLHGYGDSSNNYIEFFNNDNLKKYNILAADHLGHGESQCQKEFYDYSLANNIKILEEHVVKLFQDFNLTLKDVFLIGHSMGGDIGVRLCTGISSLKESVSGLINIEGSLTEHDLFLSRAAYARSKKGEFLAWLEYYIAKQAAGFSKAGTYIENLKQTHPIALEQNAIEFYENHLNAIKANDGFTHIMGKFLANLTTSNLFIYGDGTHEKTIDFIKQMKINSQYIKTDSHWVMFEPQFIHVLQRFIQQYYLSRHL